MPELPEVHTTATALNRLLPKLKVVDIWSLYKSDHYKGKPQIKNPVYFKKFKREVVGSSVLGVRRRAKNVLIDLSNGKTILIHMKMTGHLLYGKYEQSKTDKNEWFAGTKGPLQDKWNGWIRLVFTLSNGKHLALSDLRKFAKVTLLDTETIFDSNDLKDVGPEFFDLNLKTFTEQINKREAGRIKNVLMDQNLLAGVGNIYSDEALWLAQIHPETSPKKLERGVLKKLFANLKKVLNKGIDFKGDSMSDYRRPSGKPGDFQNYHQVYGRKGKDCKRRACKGIISRIVVGGRSAHFCPVCQKKV